MVEQPENYKLNHIMETSTIDLAVSTINPHSDGSFFLSIQSQICLEPLKPGLGSRSGTHFMSLPATLFKWPISLTHAV